LFQIYSRAGIKAVPYHAKIPLAERSENLDKYRRYVVDKSDDEEEWEETVPVLVCTDLASRGLDVPGVTAVVQLQFAGNVVAHLHRMGRCGRAGKRDGRGVIFYDTTEAELVAIVQEAESRQDRMVLEQDVDDNEPESNEDGKGGAGSVKDAFSRKRGFTKKRKKERRDLRESQNAQEYQE
jgi:superfamily II DNA/RNA helicase